MSSLFPSPPAPEGHTPDPMGHLDPTLRREVQRRWEVRAAEWRATALAEIVFGGRVVPRLAAHAGGGGFRALLELEVPFDDLGAHREAEERFVAAARRDELLGRMPMVVLFAPRARSKVSP